MEHSAEIHYYVPPLVVEEVPGSMTTGELVTRMNNLEPTKGVLATTLDSEAAAFLASDDKLLVLLGEAGSGKSMFSWLRVQRCVQAFDVVANGLSVQGSVTVEVATCEYLSNLRRL